MATVVDLLAAELRARLTNKEVEAFFGKGVTREQLSIQDLSLMFARNDITILENTDPIINPLVDDRVV